MVRRGNNTRLWAIAALALVLLAVGSVSFVRRVGAMRPVLGVEWVQTSSGPLAVGVTPGGPAERAGLRTGDVLTEIDGRRVRSALEAAELGWGIEADGEVSLVVRRGLEQLTLRLGPDWQPQPEIYIYLAVVGLAFWASGLFIAARWPNVRGGVLYTALALGLFAQLVFSQTGVGDPFDWAVHWGDLTAGALVPALLLHMAVALSRRTVRRRRLLVGGGYAFALFLALATLWLSPAGLGGVYRFRDPLQAFEARERFEPFALAVALLIAVALLAKSYARSSSVLHRSQMRWMLWGLGMGLGPAVMLYAVPFSLGAPGLPNWAVFLAVAPMLFVPAAFTAALARYRLYDLDMLLVRGLTEVSAIFCTFAVYAAVAALLREVVMEVVPISRGATRYIGFFVAAICYPPLREWVRVGVEKAFYRKRYSYRTTLLDWARELNAETDLASLLGRLRERVRDTLGTPYAEVLLQTGPGRFETLETGDDPGVLELNGGDIERMEEESYIGVEAGALEDLPWVRYLFPMKVKDRLRALLAISERRYLEEPLSSEDRALLGTLAAHAATAIEAARLVLEVRLRVEEVEHLHARQASILESTAVGLLLMDSGGTIRAWNRALEGIYGLTRDEALRRRLPEIFPLHVVRRIERESARSADGQEARIFRLRMANRAGNPIVVNLTIKPVEGGQPGEGGAVITFDDVTERVQLEEQLLRQERLASLGLLAAGVAHEINTPLTGISSYAQLLLEDSGDDGSQRELLEKIETQTLRASRITNSLLNLARPERTTLEQLDLNGMVQEVIQLFEPQIRGTRVELRTEFDAGQPEVLGHKGKLQQVVLNLLINARDAVDTEGTIGLSTSRLDGKVVLEVTDDGVGIAEEDLPRIFDPFFTTKARRKGTGLGLSISYGIVREHDGEIQVESRPDRFTRFRIELPDASSARAMA